MLTWKGKAHEGTRDEKSRRHHFELYYNWDHHILCTPPSLQLSISSATSTLPLLKQRRICCTHAFEFRRVRKLCGLFESNYRMDFASLTSVLYAQRHKNHVEMRTKNWCDTIEKWIGKCASELLSFSACVPDIISPCALHIVFKIPSTAIKTINPQFDTNARSHAVYDPYLSFALFHFLFDA